MSTLRQRFAQPCFGASDPKPEPNKSQSRSGSHHHGGAGASAGQMHYMASEPLPSSSWPPGCYKLLLVLFAVAAAMTRFYLLFFPAAVVFDEVVFGDCLNSLLRREFYFCALSPPLSTLLLGLVSAVTHYGGEFGFARVGKEFLSAESLSEGGMFYLGLRASSALFGVMTVVLFYDMLVRIGLGPRSVAVATAMVLFDNGLIIVSRLILPDAIYLFFSLLTIYSFVRYVRSSSLGWLLATGLAVGCSASTKYAGVCYWLMTVGYALFIGPKRSSRRAKLACLVALPALLYVLVMYVQLSILIYAGPGDRFMSTPFSQSLVQTLESRAKFLPVAHGAAIRLLNGVEPVFLHSHAHNYPREHLLDAKISSSGQQVSGYPADPQDRAKDPLDYWQIYVAPPVERLSFDAETGQLALDTFDYEGLDAEQAGGPGQRDIQLGQTILLKHAVTAKFLVAHDVASALTKTNMEVTAYGGDELRQNYNNTLWRLVAAADAGMAGAVVSGAPLRLVHVATGVKLTNHQQNYPAEWGFSQREVNGDRNAVSPCSEWRIVLDEEMQSKQRQVDGSGSMGFLAKLLEYHRVLLGTIGQAITTQAVHPSQSWPLSWPLMLRGIAMWDHAPTMQQIYFLGNPLCWAVAFVGLVVYLARNGRKLRGPAKSKDGGIFALAWASHYVPYFFLGHYVFLHYYLPSYVMSVALVAVLLDQSYSSARGRTWMATLLTALLVLLIVFNFYYFSPLAYGTPMSRDEAQARRWSAGWTFLVVQPWA